MPTLLYIHCIQLRRVRHTVHSTGIIYKHERVHVHVGVTILLSAHPALGI